MEAHDLPGALKMIIDQRGCSQDDLAHELDVSQSWVSNIINGKRDTLTTNAITKLGRVGWEVVMRPKREEEPPVRRREFNAIVSVAASVTFVPTPKGDPYESADHLSRLAVRLCNLANEQGGLPLVSEAKHHMRQISPYLNIQNVRFNTAVSKLAQSASVVFHDADQMAAAQRAGTTALTAAQRARDGEEIAHAHEWMALNYRSDIERSIKFAGMGTRIPDLSPAMRARLQSRYADALTRKKNKDPLGARAVLDSAREEAGSCTPDTRALIVGNSGLVECRLGRTKEASDLLGQAVSLFANYPQPHSHSRWLAQKILVDFIADDLDVAAGEMRNLAEIAPLVRSAKLDKDLAVILRNSANRSDVPEIRDAREALLMVVRSRARA